MASTFTMKPIGIVHSCYPEKFGIPRQPGLVSAAKAHIEMLPPYNQIDAFRGLEDFSHVWVLFLFDKTQREEFVPMVRPPRLGGDKKLGVFATRATYRPNSIGLSVIKFVGIRHPQNGVLFIDLEGVDLLDKTPVLDIKPYLPYADQVPNALGGFAPEKPEQLIAVTFSPEAQSRVTQEIGRTHITELQDLIADTLKTDIRPAYKKGTEDGKEYGLAVHHLYVRWKFVDTHNILVFEVKDRKKHEAERKEQQQQREEGQEGVVGTSNKRKKSCNDSRVSIHHSNSVSVSSSSVSIDNHDCFSGGGDSCE